MHTDTNIPATFYDFDYRLGEYFQGFVDMDTKYYWNLWNDSRTNNVADWNRFLDAIALEKI